MPDPKPPPPSTPVEADPEQARLEEELEVGLKESFPASDPPTALRREREKPA